jgi:putative transposase
MGSYPSRRHGRLPDYAYTTAGFYFVTLCIQDRLPLLGRIAGGEMRLSPAGDLVQVVCEEVPRRYPDVNLDTLTVMPDHFHAILTLGGEGRSLSTVIQGIKSRITSRYSLEVASSGWPPFQGRLWQRGFYDRIIRDDEELAAAREYVVHNVQRWILKQQGV